MALNKSSRFSKISGDFGETLFLYWLGKNGFEPTFIDHTGIDLLAYHKDTNRRFGISVKTRARDEENTTYLKNDEITKINEACIAFAAEPYVGLVVDRADKNTIDCFLISLKDLLELFPQGKTVVNIGVSSSHLKKYESKNCLRLHFQYTEKGSITER